MLYTSYIRVTYEPYTSCEWLNPNKAGSHEDSFLCGRGPFDPHSPSYSKKNLCNTNIALQKPQTTHSEQVSRLKAKKCWHNLLYAAVASSFATKKCKNIQKIVKNGKYLQRKSSYLPHSLKNLNEIFRKKVSYDNIKSHRKTGFYPLSRKNSFGKTAGGGQIDPCSPHPPGF